MLTCQGVMKSSKKMPVRNDSLSPKKRIPETYGMHDKKYFSDDDTYIL